MRPCAGTAACLCLVALLTACGGGGGSGPVAHDLVSITVTPGSPSVQGGLTLQLTATGTYSDSTTANLTKTAAWSSDSAGTATVGAGSGLVTASSPGQAKITATLNGISGSTTVTVTAAAGQWFYTNGAMTDYVYGGATATLLNNGSVLVAGGDTIVPIEPALPQSTSELFNAATGLWTAAASMNSARAQHSASLLNDGRVLVAGGISVVGLGGAGGAVASAEIYDPSTAQWTLTGPMNAARLAHTAMTLPDGTILVAGGAGGVTLQPTVAPLASAEIYSASTASWTLTGSLNSARSGASGVVLATGKALIVGGGNDLTGSLASAELYDPSTGVWTPTGSLSIARVGHTATLLANGNVLVTGGESGSSVSPTATATAEIYDPVAGTWTPTGSMNVARTNHTATLLKDGTVLVAGGDFNQVSLSSAEIYNPTAGTWSLTGSMNQAYNGQTATLLQSGAVLIAGGGDQVGAAADIYYP